MAGRIIHLLGLALTAGSTSVIASVEDAPRPGPAETAVARAEVSSERIAEATAILKDLNELSASLKTEKKAAAEPRKEMTDAEVLARTGRPQRTVRKVALDAEAVDLLIDASLRKAKVAPAKITGDEEFIRRVTLDVTGKLPSPENVIAFRRSTDKAKRAMLIDALLGSPDYARNWARYWKDVVQFHATAQNPNLVRYPQMEEWLTEQFGKNRPWDEVAAAMITATGNTGETGSAVLTAAHAGQAVELAGEVSRVFLGVQIQCAQCHDHPSDRWKREQFHEFAAFFGGIQARNNNGMSPKGPSVDILDRPGKVNYRMPDLKDPTKQIPVAPRFFLADLAADSADSASHSPSPALPANLSSEQRRMLAASYITAQDNPWFAKAFVNRAWYALMGDGFFNPVDDMGPGREARNAEVLDALADAWQKGGYDVRWLFRTILNTRTYQREFRPSTTSAGRTPFAANCPSRLRADQILDALTQALGVQFDAPAGPGMMADAKKADATDKATSKDAAAPKKPAAPQKARGGPRNVFALTFGVDPSTPNEDILGTIPQALYFMNSPLINNAVKAKPGGVLEEILATSGPDERAALERLYLRVLARSPSSAEVQTCSKYVRLSANHREAFEDIFWSLINSTEFLSRK